MTVVTENYFGLFLKLDYGISKMQFAKKTKTKTKKKQTKKQNPTPNALFNFTTAYTKNEKTKA